MQRYSSENPLVPAVLLHGFCYAHSLYTFLQISIKAMWSDLKYLQWWNIFFKVKVFFKMLELFQDISLKANILCFEMMMLEAPAIYMFFVILSHTGGYLLVRFLFLLWSNHSVQWAGCRRSRRCSIKSVNAFQQVSAAESLKPSPQARTHKQNSIQEQPQTGHICPTYQLHVCL